MSSAPTTPAPAVGIDQVKTRAIACGKELEALHGQGHGINLKKARLMAEAMDGKYHVAMGLKKFEDWLDKYSGVSANTSDRTAFDLMKIVRGADAVGVTDEVLVQIPTIKLKHIFGLDPREQKVEIKKMLTKCKNKGAKYTHEQVKADCDRLKAGAKLNEDGDIVEGDSTAATPAEKPEKHTFTLNKADSVQLEKALKATNQTDKNVALMALVNVYNTYIKAASETKPAAMAA